MFEAIKQFSAYLLPLGITRQELQVQNRFWLWNIAAWSTWGTYGLATRTTTLVTQHVLVPLVKTGGEILLTKTANGLARVAASMGIGTIQEVKEVENLERFTRRNEPPPTDAQIKEEVEEFGNNIARLVSTRMIDQILCRNMQSEDFYLEMIYKSKSEEQWKIAFFHYLDQQNIFFLLRWAAKVTHRIFFPFVKKTLHDATLSIFENLESYLYVNEKKEFNDLFSHIMKKWELLLEDWIKALKTIADDGSNDGVESAGRVLGEELLKSKYHAKMPPSEFYDKVTKKAVAKYYPHMSLGSSIYQKLTGIQLLSSWKITKSAAWRRVLRIPIAFFNLSVWLLLFPIALAVRLSLFLPEHLFNRILSMGIQKAMIRNRVFENILDRALQGVSTNKGLSTPLLKALTTSLGEFLAEVRKNGHLVEEIFFNEDLSVNNQRDLKRNVGLFLSAAELYSYETITELRKNKELNLSIVLMKEGTKGIEDVIILISQKVKNANFIKQELYFSVKELNCSLAGPSRTPDERDKEFLYLEKQLSDLIRTILTEAITKKIGGLVFFLKKGEAGHNWVVNRAQKEIYTLVEKVFNMIASPNFLKYQLNAALSDFLKAE